MAARRVPLERPPSTVDMDAVKWQQTELRKRIGMRLKKLRDEADLSLRQLAMRADVSPNYLSEAERGQRGVTIDFLVRMSYHLGTTPVSFLSEES